MQTPAKSGKPRLTSKQRRSLIEFLYILPFILLVLVFAYIPLSGWIYAFFDYNPPQPLDTSHPTLKWFTFMLSSAERRKQILQVLINTFAISGIALIFSWFPMLFAILLNEIRCKPFRKFVQTVTTLPNFISWVLVFSVAFNVFSTTGAINEVGISLGLWEKPIAFLQSGDHIWFKMWLWNTWKNAGWAAIMYIAAITGIDESYMEAARVDGATRLQIIRHIIIPSILPTYFVLVMLNISNFLSTGMEQFFVFQNSFNTETIQVLDLYVYNTAMGNGGYSLSVAISILKSVVSITLLFVSNTISKKVRGEGFI